MKNPEPKVHASGWKPWRELDQVFGTDWEWEREKGHEYGGVYVLGHFPAPPGDGTAAHLCPEVIYIGMTVDLHSRPRLRHEVLNRYEEAYADRRREHLYLAGYVLDEEFRLDLRLVTFIRFLERKLIWEYVAEHGRLPRFNSV